MKRLGKSDGPRQCIPTVHPSSFRLHPWFSSAFTGVYRRLNMFLNPRVDRNTAVIVQGASGRAGRLHSRLMREYGTRIVGGVSRRMETRAIDGIPLFPDCRTAVAATGAVASVALVGAMQLLEAMREAVAAGIRYIVTPTEGVTMGHAGALTHGGHGTFAAKSTALEAAGVSVCVSINEMVERVCRRLA